MESLSNESHHEDLKKTVASLEASIETLAETNQEVYDSIKEELKEADRVWEKARVALSEVESKKVEMLRSMKSPPFDILGVVVAVMFLMAQNVPEEMIQVNEAKEPLDISWKACQMMLKKFDLLREAMLDMRKLIDEEKLSFEKTEPVREYLDMSWFHVPSLKLKSIPTAQLAEAVISIVHYFDIRREIDSKIKTALGGKGGNKVNEESHERED